MRKPTQKPNGFTLIELIVVIVILGIMAAVAAPKFVDLQSDARASVVNGMVGSLRSASTLAYSKSLINGDEGLGTSNITVSGASVDIVFGYPDATDDGIGLMIDISSDFAINDDGTYTLQANCLATYAAATNANTPANVTSDITGC